MGIFDFLNMVDNYEDRKVANYQKDGVHIDTVFVSDAKKPIETAIRHPKYNNGDWIVVDYANTKKEALLKHNKWVKKMTAKELPKEIKDVSTAEIAQLCDNKVYTLKRRR